MAINPIVTTTMTLMTIRLRAVVVRLFVVK
jgi:hypothetical protein